MQPCTQCDGESALMGVLGTLAHYRCRCCGWTFALPVDDDAFAASDD